LEKTTHQQRHCKSAQLSDRFSNFIIFSAALSVLNILALQNSDSGKLLTANGNARRWKMTTSKISVSFLLMMSFFGFWQAQRLTGNPGNAAERAESINDQAVEKNRTPANSRKRLSRFERLPARNPNTPLLTAISERRFTARRFC
jgi:hypothetical protein